MYREKILKLVQLHFNSTHKDKHPLMFTRVENMKITQRTTFESVYEIIINIKYQTRFDIRKLLIKRFEF